MTSRDTRPLPVAVLVEEMDGIARQLDGLRSTQDVGERTALLEDLLRSVDRYVRLESQVLLPAIEKLGIDVAAAREAHARIRAALDSLRNKAAQLPSSLDPLGRALDEHRCMEAEALFPALSRRLGADADGLAYELDEARGRMRGTYGV